MYFIKRLTYDLFFKGSNKKKIILLIVLILGLLYFKIDLIAEEEESENIEIVEVFENEEQEEETNINETEIDDFTEEGESENNINVYEVDTTGIETQLEELKEQNELLQDTFDTYILLIKNMFVLYLTLKIGWYVTNLVINGEGDRSI